MTLMLGMFNNYLENQITLLYADKNLDYLGWDAKINSIFKTFVNSIMDDVKDVYLFVPTCLHW